MTVVLTRARRPIQTNYSFLLPPGLATLSAGNTYYIGAGVGAEAAVNVPVAVPTTVTKLYVATGTAPGGAATITFTLRKNGFDTVVTCTITGAAVTANDTTHSIAFVAGDLWDIKIVMGGGATSTTSLMCTVDALVPSV